MEVGGARYVVGGLTQDGRRFGQDSSGRAVEIQFLGWLERDQLPVLRQLIAPLIGFQHPRLVPLLDLIEVDHQVALARGLVPWDRLAFELSTYRRFAPARALHIAADVLEALSVVRGRGIEPEVCVPDDVLIADELSVTGGFGQTRACLTNTIGAAVEQLIELRDSPLPDKPPKHIVNVDYYAPEVLFGISMAGIPNGASAKDVYAVGTLLWHMLVADGPPPDPYRVFKRIGQAHGPAELREAYGLAAAPPAMNSELSALLDSLRNMDPAQRPPVSQLIPDLRALAHTMLAVPPIPVGPTEATTRPTFSATFPAPADSAASNTGRQSAPTDPAIRRLPSV